MKQIIYNTIACLELAMLLGALTVAIIKLF